MSAATREMDKYAEEHGIVDDDIVGTYTTSFPTQYREKNTGVYQSPTMPAHSRADLKTLEKLSLVELKSRLLQSEILLTDKDLLNRLPDKGEKVQKKVEQLNALIASKLQVSNAMDASMIQPDSVWMHTSMNVVEKRIVKLSVQIDTVATSAALPSLPSAQRASDQSGAMQDEHELTEADFLATYAAFKSMQIDNVTNQIVPMPNLESGPRQNDDDAQLLPQFAISSLTSFRAAAP